jgi:hypothetical protein
MRYRHTRWIEPTASQYGSAGNRETGAGATDAPEFRHVNVMRALRPCSRRVGRRDGPPPFPIPPCRPGPPLVDRAKFVAGKRCSSTAPRKRQGGLAVQISKHLGAKRMIATGPNTSVLTELATLGADSTVPLTGDWDANLKAFEGHSARGRRRARLFVGAERPPSAHRRRQSRPRPGANAVRPTSAR